MFVPCFQRSQKLFDLELTLADASGFVPMQLSTNYLARGQTHSRNAFPLPPPSAAVTFAQTCQFADTRAHGNRFDGRELSNDFKVHDTIVAKIAAPVKLTRARGLTRNGEPKRWNIKRQSTCRLRVVRAWGRAASGGIRGRRIPSFEGPAASPKRCGR